MSIALSDLKIYGSASMPDDDTPTQIGGAIDTQRKPLFYDVGAAIQCVSSAGGDTTQTVTLHYRDSAGNKQSEAKTLSGQTPVAFTATPERLLKAIKSATCAGDVAVEAATAERAGTAQAGTGITITLDAGASASNDFYNGMVIRLTSGTGNGQIREIIAYDGTTKVATAGSQWGTTPDATSVFRIAKGMVFDKSPAEILECRRVFYDSGANPAGGATKEYHEKWFLKNTHATLSLTTAVVKEIADPSGLITFMLAASVDDSGTNGSGNNRLVAPSGTFDNSNKSVPGGGSLAAGSAIGVWGKLTLAGGAAAQKTTYTPQLEGNTT